EYSVKILNEMEFFTLNISKIDEKLQKKFLKSKELEQYRHFLEETFKYSKHVLSEAEEKILNLKGKVSYGNWVRMTSGFLAKEERVVLNENKKKESKNYSEILGLIDSTDKSVRDSAANALNEITLKWIEVG